MKVVCAAVTALFFLQCSVESARILGVFPFNGKSHYFLGSALMRALAEKGHDVTVISLFGETTPVNGSYRDIVLTETFKVMEARRGEVDMYAMGETSPFLFVPMGAYLLSELGEFILQDKSVQELIHSGEKFDAVIVEQFYADALKVLAPHFDAIQIVFCTVPTNIWIDPLVGNPSPPSYIPDLYLSYSPQMTFSQRLVNTLIYGLNVIIHHFYLYPKFDRVAQQFIPNAPNLNDVLYNASLVLINSHPSFNQPVPHVPNMVEIAGFHIKPPKKLPKDLQEFLDSAKEGVIYFSMGSNLRSIDLPVEKRDAILKSFSKLKQKVLWKWEEETLPNQPKNVKLGKWFPQQSILAHPNVKLFITHGGMLSTTETIYFGVPVLAIPTFGDQKLNAKLAADNGYGVYLPYKELTEKTFTEKLNEVLNNPKYAENAKTKSEIFHDREATPINTALYWIEYVIRHNGAPHLRVAAVDLPWYQYLLLDVIVFLILTVLLGLSVTYFVFKKICHMFCVKEKQKVKIN